MNLRSPTAFDGFCIGSCDRAGRRATKLSSAETMQTEVLHEGHFVQLSLGEFSSAKRIIVFIAIAAKLVFAC